MIINNDNDKYKKLTQQCKVEPHFVPILKTIALLDSHIQQTPHLNDKITERVDLNCHKCMLVRFPKDIALEILPLMNTQTESSELEQMILNVYFLIIYS